MRNVRWSSGQRAPAALHDGGRRGGIIGLQSGGCRQASDSDGRRGVAGSGSGRGERCGTQAQIPVFRRTTGHWSSPIGPLPAVRAKNTTIPPSPHGAGAAGAASDGGGHGACRPDPRRGVRLLRYPHGASRIPPTPPPTPRKNELGPATEAGRGATACDSPPLHSAIRTLTPLATPRRHPSHRLKYSTRRRWGATT